MRRKLKDGFAGAVPLWRKFKHRTPNARPAIDEWYRCRHVAVDRAGILKLLLLQVRTSHAEAVLVE